jgi:uncharacterized protein (TIGR00369 family)
MAIPEGFSKHDRHSPLTDPWEPIFARRESDRLRLGLKIRTAHTNSRGLLHGGLIAALADNAMGLSLGLLLEAEGRRPERGLVTTSLTVDFLGRAQLGQWLEVDTTFVHAGRRHGVAQAFVTGNGEIIARANASFMIG